MPRQNAKAKYRNVDLPNTIVCHIRDQATVILEHPFALFRETVRHRPQDPVSHASSLFAARPIQPIKILISAVTRINQDSFLPTDETAVVRLAIVLHGHLLSS